MSSFFRGDFGTWNVFVPDGEKGLRHNTLIKVAIEVAPGKWEDRIPAWDNRVTQRGTQNFDGVFWDPEVKYQWKHPVPPKPKSLRIYESHGTNELLCIFLMDTFIVGMSSVEPKINSYVEFTRDVVPYVAGLGYNCIQLMAIMEHAYYASFGYQVCFNITNS